MKPEERELASLRNQHAELMKKMSAIHKLMYKKYELPEKKKNIGRCFKFRNSYGNPKQGWWLYTMITDVQDGDYTLLEFEQDAEGRASIRVNRGNPVDRREYLPITAQEFITKFKAVRAELLALALTISEQQKEKHHAHL